MSIATRKIIGFFFLVFGIAPLLFSLALNLKKWEIRLSMTEKLEYRKLQTIRVPENEVIFMDKHEIWVNDHMFDIHSKKLENGVYTFTGLYDKEETKLVKNQQKVPGKSNHQTRLLSQLFKSFPQFFQQQGETSNKPVRPLYNSSPAEHLLSPSKEILTPPPQA